MATEVRLSPQAARAYRQLAKSDRKLFSRVDTALERLRTEPEAGKPLQGPLAGRRSLRVGPLRIVYRHEARRILVLVLAIAPRGSAYRDLLTL